MIQIKVANYSSWLLLMMNGGYTSKVVDNIVEIKQEMFEFLEAFDHLGDKTQYEKFVDGKWVSLN